MTRAVANAHGQRAVTQRPVLEAVAHPFVVAGAVSTAVPRAYVVLTRKSLPARLTDTHSAIAGAVNATWRTAQHCLTARAAEARATEILVILGDCVHCDTDAKTHA